MEETDYRYDVYLSSCPEDADWAEEWLRPRLEAAGLRVGSESDFDLGVARVVNVERAVTGSRNTLLVLTPAWVKSGWAEFESVLTQSRAIDDQAPRTLPLLLEPCQPPLRIAALNYADFTQAQRRETKLQQVITAARGERDIKVVGATLSQFLDNRGRMLQKVHSFWVEGVLESALQGQAALDLNLVDIPNAVPKAWTSVVDLLTNTPQPLPTGTPIDELFDQHDGALLIFGGPGGGKTTLLLQLARTLLTNAEWNPGYPMPIVFNLSSWGKQCQPLTDWLVEELNAKYDVPQKLARAWVAEDQIIPLLDGLDEVDATQRAACVDTINAFRKEHGFMRMAVCCRQAEYESLPRQLRLGGAVLVQPLTTAQVDAYLAHGGEPLIGLRAAVHVDPALQELAQTPLMLGIMIGAYRGQSARTLLAQGARGGQQQRLFAAYVDRMFARRGTDPRYSRAQTERWLTWLARGMQRQKQSVFLIEHLQPNWLATRTAIAQYTLLDRLGWGLVSMLVVGALIGLPAGFGVKGFYWRNAVSVGLTVGLVVGLFGGHAATLQQRRLRLIYAALNALIGGLTLGLIGWLGGRLVPGLIAATANGAILGIIIGALAGKPSIRPRRINVVERLRWSWRKAWPVTLIGMLFGGLLMGLILIWALVEKFGELIASDLSPIFRASLSLGLFCATIFGLVGGISSAPISTTTIPNQGIKRSARSAILAGLGCSLGIILVVGIVIAANDFRDKGFLQWTVSGFISTVLLLSIFGIPVCLVFGGYSCLSHLALRFVLWRSGAVPWDYAAFLDYAAGRVFLRKVGGGYIFAHRTLLEYFAALPDAQADAQVAPAPASQPVASEHGDQLRA